MESPIRYINGHCACIVIPILEDEEPTHEELLNSFWKGWATAMNGDVMLYSTLQEDDESMDEQS